MAAQARNIVGVDFGTSTSFVATPAAAPVPLGQRNYVPSIAGVLDRRLLVGEAAMVLPPDRIIRSAKRAITDNQAQLAVGGRYAKSHRPRDQVIMAILKELRIRARKSGVALKASDTLRLGCPAEWTGEKRQLLLDLATAGGLPTGNAEIMEEPVSAGVDWLEQQVADGRQVDGRLLVFDMGGGTLDVAVMQVVIGSGSQPQITVLTSKGSKVAGDALDDAIFDDIVAHYEFDLPSMTDPQRAAHNLHALAVDTKHRLSGVETVDVLLNARVLGMAKMAALPYPRERLNQVFGPLLDDAEATVVDALRLARFAELGGADISGLRRMTPAELAKDIDFVLLIGGMSRVPLVQQRLRALFPRAEFVFDYGRADEGVVNGLISTTQLNSINMYRPAFDLELVLPDERIKLYVAYTPLFGSDELMRGQSKLAYRYELPVERLPRKGNGLLEAYAATGERVGLTHRLKSAFAAEERTVDALPVRLGHYPVRLALYTDGRIHVTDGHGDDHELRIEGWPTLIRPGTSPDDPPDDPPVYYPFNKS